MKEERSYTASGRNSTTSSSKYGNHLHDNHLHGNNLLGNHLANGEIKIQRSSIVKQPVIDDNILSMSDDNIVHTRAASHNGRHFATTQNSVNQKFRASSKSLKSHESFHINKNKQLYNNVRSNDSQTRSVCDTLDSSNSSKYQVGILQPEKSMHDSTLSSQQSDDSPYLNLSGDRYEQNSIDHRKNTPYEHEVGHSRSEAMGYSLEGGTRSNLYDSGYLGPYDPLALEQAENRRALEKFTVNHDFINEDIMISRIHICKYVAIFFVVITAIVCLLFGILYHYVGYYPETFHLNEGDVRLISASSYFCDGIMAVSRTSDLRVIIFKKKTESKYITNTVHENIIVVQSEVWERDFYILSGSTVTLKIKSQYTLEILVFVGEQKKLIWTQRKESDTYLEKVSCCAGYQEKEKEITFAISVNERYYFVVHNHMEIIPVTCDVDITFKRLTFDMTDTTPAQQCLTTASKSCSVDYSFDDGESAALEVPLSKHGSRISMSSEVEWKCVARIWFYVVLFASAFIIIIALIFTSYYLTVTFCITSKRCCCGVRDDNSEFFYNKYNRGGDFDNIVGEKTFSPPQSIDLALVSPSHKSSSVYKSIQSTPTNSRPSSFTHSQFGSSKRQNIVVSPGVATIYEGDKYHGDNRYRNTSLGSEYSHSRQSYKEDAVHLQELQIQQLQTLRTEPQPLPLEISDGPSVHQIMERRTKKLARQIYLPNNSNTNYNTYSNRTDYNSVVDEPTSFRDNYGYETALSVPDSKKRPSFDVLNDSLDLNDLVQQSRNRARNSARKKSLNNSDYDNEYEMRELSKEKPKSSPSEKCLPSSQTNSFDKRHTLHDSFDDVLYV